MTPIPTARRLAPNDAIAFISALALSLPLMPSALAQESYRKPPAAIVDVLEAPRLPSVRLSPDSTTMLLVERQNMPTLADMAQPMLRLAGRRVNPNTNGMHGNSGEVGMILKSVDSGAERRVELPADVRIAGARWSPDGSRIAFALTHEDGSELWLCDVATAEARPLTPRTLNTISGGGFSWMPNGSALLVHLVPAKRGPAPEESAVPPGPVVQESSGRTSPVRTYQDLLENPHDEALFEHYFTSQLVLLDVSDGNRTPIDAPAIYAGASPSADGRFLLLSRIVAPYSYMVPVYSFAREVEILELDTSERRLLVRTPVADDVPIQGVPTGPRSHQWRSNVGSSDLVWVEALDGGDPKREVDHRDRVMVLADPLHGDASEVVRLEDRFSGVTWIKDHDQALVTEYDRDERWSRTWLDDLAPGSSVASSLVYERDVQDRYGDPGRPYMVTNAAGRGVAMRTGDWVFMSGRGATPAGDRPFLSRRNVATGETRELWRNDGACYESFAEMLPDHRIITRYETPDEPPNYCIYDTDRDTRTAITSFEHPAPQLRDIRKELVTYTRSDGIALSATLYLPPGYEEGRDAPLPLLVWAYPREFNNARTAGQVSGSPHRFTTIGGSSHLFMLLQGYAIMDSATMPVVGSDPETVNDTFIDQIVASAQAAIDYAAERGVGDPARVGVGGHSYGAFMTANLLAHSDLFSAGVARSGAYNRTLTPFGFQSERRTFWEAPDVYFNLSPFMHADQIDAPLLLIHGERDNNSGTFPIQSRRLYHAVNGHGGTVRLVMLPFESHGYRAEESIMHVLAEMVDWFDLHVKGSG